MKTFLDWSSYEDAGLGDAYADIPKSGGDYAKAVAVCINSRHCEEKNKGVMCPSYRVTDNPLLSTGGRVRLLKQALNSDDVMGSLDDAELVEAMDLCLGCKGCKRECENEVDMAMIKIEYLAQHHARHSIPLRTRLFAQVPEILSRVNSLPTLIRVWNKHALLAGWLRRLLKLADRRLPQPEGKTFLRQYKGHPVENGVTNDDGKGVVLFIDTFTNHFAAENALAAIDILQSAGYRVHIAQGLPGERLCCGRTQLAYGLVEKARVNAQRVVAALMPFVEAGMPVIGLEPACLLAIRDDYKFLGLGEPADKLAAQAILFEEFLARETTAKRFELDLKPVPDLKSPVLVHGHCHQKAVGAMKSMRKVLKMIPGLKFELIESSCCGMAGSFGLEAEHYQASKAMAELSLVPAVRQQPDAEIIANGFSCRHQIHDTTQRQSMHIARLLHASLHGLPL